MTTMTMTAQEWTDGITLVRREGRQVTVQILGDVYITRYADDDEAMIAYAAEIAGAMDGRCTFTDDDSADGCIEDDYEWIRRGC
jgi:hypothetical protein